jgi:hypothetical protein
MGGQSHAQAILFPAKKPGTHCTASWVRPAAGLDDAENLAPPRYEPRTVQPVVSRYRDYAIPAHILYCIHVHDIYFIYFIYDLLSDKLMAEIGVRCLVVKWLASNELERT